MELPVLLLEFEGVIADTATIRRTALVESLDVEGLIITDEMLDAAIGYPTEEGIRRVRRAAGAKEDETAVELGRLRAERRFAIRAGQGLQLMPGVREALKVLAAHCRLAIVSRASRREIEFTLALADLESLFRPVIGADDVSPPKPSRAPWDAAMVSLGQIRPGQQLKSLAVEDCVTGIRAARAAGFASVAVGAFKAHDALEADAWVESLADLSSERVRALTGISAGGRR